MQLIDVILPDESRLVQHQDNRSESLDENNYVQEYDFETVQHFQSEKGFKFSFDGIVIEAAADHQRESAVTKLSGIGGEAEISRKGAYSYNKDGESYVFTALPKETFPVYFQTNDGIKTEMSLAAGLTHTRITVTQSQLFDFDGVYPKLDY
ncbi:MAG: hypothetical protein ACLU5F_11700, partial [Anaerovoracaceae bacterium]